MSSPQEILDGVFVRPCPTCKKGTQMRQEGKLDQCQYTYLPAYVWTCDGCDRTDFERTGEPWRKR